MSNKNDEILCVYADEEFKVDLRQNAQAIPKAQGR